MISVSLLMLVALSWAGPHASDSSQWALSVERAQPGEATVAQESAFWVALRNTSSTDRVVCLESLWWEDDGPTGLGGSVFQSGPHHPCDNFEGRKKVKAGQSLMIPASIPSQGGSPSFHLRGLDLGASGDLSRLTSFEVSCQEESSAEGAAKARR